MTIRIDVCHLLDLNSDHSSPLEVDSLSSFLIGQSELAAELSILAHAPLKMIEEEMHFGVILHILCRAAQAALTFHHDAAQTILLRLESLSAYMKCLDLTQFQPDILQHLSVFFLSFVMARIPKSLIPP